MSSTGVQLADRSMCGDGVREDTTDGIALVSPSEDDDMTTSAAFCGAISIVG
jgi:hypothetical protein